MIKSAFDDDGKSVCTLKDAAVYIVQIDEGLLEFVFNFTLFYSLKFNFFPKKKQKNIVYKPSPMRLA